jgi:ribosomal protein L11 methyltransferase
MEWVELIVHTTTEGSDEVSSLLMDGGAAGTMIEDRADIPDPNKPHGIWEIIDPKLLENMPEDVLVHAWLEPDERLPVRLEQFRLQLEKLKASTDGFGSLSMDCQSVNDEQWKDIWKKYYKPFYACDHLAIKPTWEAFSPAPGDRVIEIDPGMAFGSGTHETTGMCMSLLNEVIHGGESVIDVGTGSGILAICAAKLGASLCRAYDIDPVAVRVAVENCEKNGCADIIECGVSDLLKQVKVPSDGFDFAVANIVADIIIRLSPDIGGCLKSGACYITSGIIEERENDVVSAMEKQGFERVETVRENGWCAVVFKNK